MLLFNRGDVLNLLMYILLILGEKGSLIDRF